MRPIDADALPKFILISANVDDDVLKIINAFKKMINEAPTIKTESNVHCKDCRYWKEASGCLENYKRCICLDRDTNAYFYCAWGEKKKR